MNVYVNFRFSARDQEEFSRAKEFFATRGYGLTADGLNLYANGKRENYTGPDPIETHYMRKAYSEYLDFAKAVDCDFVIDGTIDISETAGEYMDFRFENNGGKTNCYCSDYYVDFNKAEYASFEAFREEFGDRYTKEYFDELSDENFYLIQEDGENNYDYVILVKEVPLNPIRVEEFAG